MVSRRAKVTSTENTEKMSWENQSLGLLPSLTGTSPHVHCLWGCSYNSHAEIAIPLAFTVFLLLISQQITSPFKNLAGLQLLFWDLPTSHLQKQRRMMSSMALGAPSWKSSCLRQGHSLSKMSQPIPSVKKMGRMKMKCIHKLHFHMLLSCSEL